MCFSFFSNIFPFFGKLRNGGSCLGFTGLHFPEDALDYGSQDQDQEDSQQHQLQGGIHENVQAALRSDECLTHKS